MLSKLTKLHVTIIGVVVCLVVGVGTFFLLIKPDREKLQELQAEYDARKAIADQYPQAKAELQRARLAELQAQKDYRRVEDMKMPVVSFGDRVQGMIGMWREQAEILGPMLQNWPRRFGVEFPSNIPIPAASTDPNTYKNELITIPIGSVSVTGDLESILRHIAGWNQFGRLVQVDLASIEGISPALKATYKLSVLMFPRGPFGAVPSVAGEGGAAPGAVGVVAPPPIQTSVPASPVPDAGPASGSSLPPPSP